MISIPVHYSEIETLYDTIRSQKAQSVAVMGGQHGTGVTTLAIALARRAGSDGRKVLLLELNHASPMLADLYEVEEKPWQFSDHSWQQAISPTEDGFDLLSASNLRDAPDFHGGERLAQGLGTLAEQYELVVIDTSPLSRQNRHNVPPELVATSAHFALLCVLTGVCTEMQLLENHARIRRAGAEITGVVMNDRFAPGLLEELYRECRRLLPFMPALSHRLQRWLSACRILRQQL